MSFMDFLINVLTGIAIITALPYTVMFFAGKGWDKGRGSSSTMTVNNTTKNKTFTPKDMTINLYGEEAEKFREALKK